MNVSVYIALPDNEHYLGSAPLTEVCLMVYDSSMHAALTLCKMASQIASAVGPSGANRDYLLNLARAMREIAPGK